MKITRVFTGFDGRSHFSEFTIPFEEPGRYSAFSLPIEVGPASFRETPADGFYELHNAPARQLVVILNGRVEFQCGDGDTRTLAPGDILLAEDTEGEGHSSRELLGVRQSLFLPLAPGAIVPGS